MEKKKDRTAYQRAGVDIEEANMAVGSIKELVRSTYNPRVIRDVGLFSGLIDISFLKEYKNPVLVQSIDGVGTKMIIAKKMNKFDTIGEPVQNQWTYHAVANVILAHSLIRSFEEVDSGRTAVTGISWGGYLTCIVAGLDNRFKAAVPVYGCGFLHENSTWLNEFARMKPEQKDKWVQLWDPSMYIGSASMPVFFVNGTNDFAYPLDSYAKTYGQVRGGRNIRITVNMPHGHPQGWAPEEIGLFVDEHLKNGIPLPKMLSPRRTVNRIHAGVKSKTKLVSGTLHYTTGNGPVNKRQWGEISGRFEGSSFVTALPPEDTTIWFLTVTDERGAVVSSELVFADK